MDKNETTTYAHHVWLGGHIYTEDDQAPLATALACEGQKLIYVGDDETAQKLIGPNTLVTDLKGHTVVPGFIEGHAHLQSYGESLLRLRIRDLSRQEILKAVGEAVKELAPGTWLVGGMGWNNEVWSDPSYPTRQELDAVSPHNPVMLPRMDGHMIWVNTQAFSACGITDDTPDPEGGEFFRNPDKTLHGCVANKAADMIKYYIPKPDKERRVKALLAAQKQLLAYGVTSVNDMSTDWENVCDLKELYEKGMYKLRFHGALRNALGQNADPKLYEYFLKCPEIDLYDKHYTVRAVKFLADGSVGAQSAALTEEYSDRPGHFGTRMYTDQQFYQEVSEAARHHMQAITHAIGDAAIDQVLRIYQQVLDEVPVPDHRFHIEHFQTITGDSRERAAKLGVWASMQPTHAPNSASMALRRLGETRAKGAYAAGLVLEILGRISCGSDAPVAPPDPLDGIHSAVTRTNGNLEPKGGFFPENAMTREQALKGYTIWGAYAQFTERDKGSLEKGKLADFVVLDQDLMTVDEDDLLRVRVLETIIGGETVYRSANR
ncbi:MAG: amidohydrolase [Hungatella sp.]|jgi:predicted amidohydrolase YtcJ|nr:amidohydrolase [Hungatella sp.]MCI9635774.1 amidohydrolase [Hungatella sp.]